MTNDAPVPMLPWHSAWKPALDTIVHTDPPAQIAVSDVLAFGEREGLSPPDFYVSTAITSAGWVDPLNPTRADIDRNNHTAALILQALASNEDSLITPESVMVPTELGHVPSWGDTDYLLFYFAWMAGLNGEGAARLTDAMKSRDHWQMVQAANTRGVANDQRWPSYKEFTGIALTELSMIETIEDIKANDGARCLLQLVDTAKSLGCKAELMYAAARHLDVTAPSFAADLGGDLGADVTALQHRGCPVGAQRFPVELTPLKLSPRP